MTARRPAGGNVTEHGDWSGDSERASWLPDLEAELFVFPGSRHDDQCDSISQALLDKNNSFNARRHRSRRHNRLKQMPPPKRQPSRSRNASHVGQRVYRCWGPRAGVRLSPRVPCEPVSACNRTSLRSTEMEIGKWRAETGARNPRPKDENARNCRPETGGSQPNSREYQRFSPTRKNQPGDRTAWLPFLDTYRTMCLAPQPDFRRLLEDVLAFQLAA